jgi:HAD superfamily hydrolase (TIGR01490 family)
MVKIICFFDFDGTITKKDTLIDFIQFAFSKPTYYFGLFRLTPMLMAYIFKFISNHIAKEKLISYFFKGWVFDRFQAIADQYAITQIDKIVRPKAIEKIAWHQAQNHKIVIVSASMESWLKKWTQKHNIDLISTYLEIKDGKLTGQFSTKNCYGIEKVNRIKEQYKLSEYDCIYAYGDSSGDKEMLRLADMSYYKLFT